MYYTRDATYFACRRRWSVDSVVIDTKPRTHESFLPWLAAYALDFSNVVQSNTVLAEQSTVDNKISLLALRREDWRLLEEP